MKPLFTHQEINFELNIFLLLWNVPVNLLRLENCTYNTKFCFENNSLLAKLYLLSPLHTSFGWFSPESNLTLTDPRNYFTIHEIKLNSTFCLSSQHWVARILFCFQLKWIDAHSSLAQIIVYQAWLSMQWAVQAYSMCEWLLEFSLEDSYM